MAVYEGSEKYIFVSYAHKDSDVVIPMIDAMMAAGFRVWYDQGIQAGTEWPEYIETHMDMCEVVLVCMSPATVNSVNCRNEINYASMLQKEMLVVYLEPTELAKGMNLQLNSKQSLFKYRHQTDETFLRELVDANILKSCRSTSGKTPDVSKINIPAKPQPKPVVEDNGDRLSTVKSRLGGKPIVGRVGTIGSNTPSEAWPKGTYSNRIDVNKFRAVHFHCNLIHSFTTAGTRTVGLRIFDNLDNLVFEDISKISFNTGHDRFSLGWIVRDEAGMAQTPGLYTAVFWIDDSRAFEYTFELCAEQVASGYAEAIPTIPVNSFTPKLQKELDTLKKRSKIPGMYVLHLIAGICGLISLICLSNVIFEEDLIPVFIFAIPCLVLSIILCAKTKKYVVGSGFLAFLFVFIGGIYYGIYLLIMTIVWNCKKRKWLARIAELESMK